MAPSRRQISGRSPLVNPQRQITSFFGKSSSPSPSPLSNKKTPKSYPNPSSPSPSPSPPLPVKQNPNPISARSPSPGPATPSPVQSKLKKPLLVIGQTPSPPKSAVNTFGDEVVGKQVRVYWPLDKKWYDGCVTSYNKGEGKHVIEYDDGEEESLDLGKEMIDWGVGQKSGERFKRLRRGASAFRRVVTDDDDDDVEMGNVEEEKENICDGDDSSDEDWVKNAGKSFCESEEDDEDEMMDEEELDEETPKVNRVSKTDSRKRKSSEVAKSGSEKKFRIDKDTTLKGFKASVVEPAKKIEQADRVVKRLDDNILDGDALARFGARESEKFRFLGVDRRDAKRRRPTDENYDPRTLYLPPDFVKRLTGGQRQWWEFKSKHMDKVVFFKMGKFYELFEMDAHVGAKELDLQYMKGEQPHCGFPEKNFSVNIEKLVKKGYRVLVVEQTETPDQLEQRRKEKGSKDKVVKREICAVVTRGTLIDGEMLLTNPDASYLMALTEGGESLTDQKAEHNFGVCLVDVATKKIILGQFKDDQDCSALSCMLSEIRPVEIIKPANVLSSATERTIVRHTRNPLINNLVPLSEFWDAEKTIHEVGIFYKRISCQLSSAYSGEGRRILGDGSLSNESGSSFLPKMLSELATGDKNGSLALSALGGAIYYLRQAFLDESLLRFAKFETLPCCDFNNFTEKHMVLDAAALENLEIFENSRNGGFSGTLYAQLNQCVTASGKRLLKTWLARPLYNPKLIKERQVAVAILRGENLPYSLEFRKALSRLPDMERLIARIFSSIEASGRNGDKVVLYEDVAKKQLQEFISTLRGCETMVEACSSLRVILKHDKSGRLLHLLTPGQSLPNISSSIKYFKDAFDWVEAHNSGRVVPHEGADEEYDFTCKTVKELESSLTKHLKEQRKLLGDASINYVTVGKDEYLLEVPESLSGNVPQDYELCSSKKGVFRYWTPTIKKLLKKLSQAKSEKESALKSISQRLIGRFCEHQEKWRQLVSVTAELDVLISLAFASDSYEGVRCSPVISGSTSDDVPQLSATGLGHPVLRGDSLGRGSFVPNNVKIGGSKQASFILLTGPNMGGKSTLLRQVCLAVILAQIGADVPAETFELSPVDRIFVRMGAKDHIMAGQSTFLTELSETAVMLSSATRNSLVVLDELGRGTATSDGQAIAESVLEHFIDKVQCRGMFSTHYHRLSMDYQTNPKVSLCHMACQVGEGIGGVEEVTFLYRLTPGACPKSYGVNVARLAGLPDCVLQRAVIKSQEFEAVYGKNHRKTDRKMAEMIKKIIGSVASDSDYSTSKDSLSELHYMANTFLRLI